MTKRQRKKKRFFSYTAGEKGGNRVRTSGPIVEPGTAG